MGAWVELVAGRWIFSRTLSAAKNTIPLFWFSLFGEEHIVQPSADKTPRLVRNAAEAVAAARARRPQLAVVDVDGDEQSALSQVANL
jgi:hypothetical protein